jgi:hypothetical protein
MACGGGQWVVVMTQMPRDFLAGGWWTQPKLPTGSASSRRSRFTPGDGRHYRTYLGRVSGRRHPGAWALTMLPGDHESVP